MAEFAQTFNFESKKLLASSQFENMVRLEAEADKPIKKVLSVRAQAKIENSEKVGEFVNFSGKTTYNVVYETEAGDLKSLYADAEWQNKVACQCEQFFLTAQAEENVITGTSSTEISVSTLTRVDVHGVYKDKVPMLEGLDENYVSSQKDISYERVVNLVSTRFNEVVEQELAGKVDDVLYSTADVKIDRAFAGIDAVTLEGKVFVSTYLLQNGNVVAQSKELDFKEEINALSTLPSHLVDCHICVSSLKVSASVSDIDQKSNIIYAVELSANATIYAKENVTLIEDTFSLNKQTNTTVECVLKENYEGEQSFSQNFTTSFETEEEINQILYVEKLDFLPAELKEGENSGYAGWVDVSLVCENDEHEKFSVKANLPYLFELENLGKDDKVGFVVKSQSAKLKTKHEVELSTELELVVKNYSTEFVNFVSSVDELEEKEQSDVAIRVYVVEKGEDLFSACKQLNVRPDDLVRQNPSASEQLEPGSKLVVYYPLNINF